MYNDCASECVSTRPSYQLEQVEKALRVPTTRERLTERKVMMEKRLEDINAALDALDKFPEF